MPSGPSPSARRAPDGPRPSAAVSHLPSWPSSPWLAAWFQNELVLLDCTFEEPTPGVTRDGNVFSSKEGGALEVKMDAEIFYPYRERRGFQVSRR